MPKNTYLVTAQFERARTDLHVESWTGCARNIRLAMRQAASTIMQRTNVKRYRHARATFTIEKILPST